LYPDFVTGDYLRHNKKSKDMNIRTEKMEEIRQLIGSGNKMDNPLTIFINSDKKGCFVVYPENRHKGFITINEVNKLRETYPDVKVIWFLNNPVPEEDYKGQEPEMWAMSRFVRKAIDHTTDSIYSNEELEKRGILFGFIEKNGRKDLSVEFIEPQP
jgi:hypothetical protein